eukprot:TRINITY_DN31785_c0_g1_i1.p1 TRINITY_DN31785_c0_g1~~TRINITY_DN31785_c0_g1_i1.p1  ORF type:complete len:190 (-),score=45.36 TRINITY_DN31785_c0_g1_i1:94-639(-)
MASAAARTFRRPCGFGAVAEFPRPVCAASSSFSQAWRSWSFSSPLGAEAAGGGNSSWAQASSRRAFGGWRRGRGAAESQSSFSPYPMVPYGVKRSTAYKDSKKAARKAAERARRTAEEKGLLLDPKKQLRMELKRNSGIGWYRAGQIIKHLEMHERGKGPPIDQAARDRITEIARVVRMGK